MVKKTSIKSESIYQCEVCGFGYADQVTAKECEDFCTANGSCSLKITRKAVYKPP